MRWSYKWLSCISACLLLTSAVLLLTSFLNIKHSYAYVERWESHWDADTEVWNELTELAKQFDVGNHHVDVDVPVENHMNPISNEQLVLHVQADINVSDDGSVAINVKQWTMK